MLAIHNGQRTTDSSRMLSMDGILIIDKPAGFTSHDVVARARRILGERRIGHTGTLDPFATGVLVLLIGRATRLAQFLMAADKEYEAVVRLGFATDTGDIDGTRLSHPVPAADLYRTSQEIRNAFQDLTGEIWQLPPMYSAKKRDGRKLYEFARRGEEVERELIKVTIHAFTSLESEPRLVVNPYNTADLRVRVVCSSGTYIRTLAEDFGKLLGLGAHLAKLCRTRAGAFEFQDAITLEGLEQLVEERSLEKILRPPDAALSGMPFVHLNDSDGKRARNGIAIPFAAALWSDGEKVRILDDEDQLIGVGVFDSERQLLHPRVVLN